MNITEILQRHAEQFPDEIAIIDRVGGSSRQTTYRELDQAVGRMAALLRHSGLKAGDKVLLFHPMSIELYTALAAILAKRNDGHVCGSVGGAALYRSLLRVTSGASTDRQLEGASVAIAFARPAADPDEVVDWWSRPVHSIDRTSVEIGTMIDASTRCKSDTAALASFTSGSTGQPKAAIRTHGFLLAQHRAVEESFALATRGGRACDNADLRAGESCFACHQHHRRCRPSTSIGNRAAAGGETDPGSSSHSTCRVTRVPRADCRLLRTKKCASQRLCRRS